MRVCVRACVRASARVSACVRGCVRACVRACECACACACELACGQHACLFRCIDTFDPTRVRLWACNVESTRHCIIC